MHNGFASNNGLGCNISISFSDGSFEDSQINRGATSPKKASFFDNFMRKSPPANKNPKHNSWTSIFSKKSATKPVEEVKKQNDKEVQDEEMAKFIQQLTLEGKSEEEINLHLSYIHDNHTPTPSELAPTSTKNKNILSQFICDVQQTFKEIVADEMYPYPEQFQEDIRGLTISISSAPFYGALPPDMDMSYEEFASLEPVYVGSRCINNLPSCTHDGSPLPGDQTKCSVCLCNFAESETLKSLPCVHFFHKDCIDTWLMVGHTCPLCKTLIE